MQLLKKRLTQITNSKNSDVKCEIRHCICLHQVLLEVYWRARNMYSIMLMFHYFVTMITTCSDLFILIGQPDTVGIVVMTVTLTFILVQFACYTFPAEQIAFEFNNLSLILYTSKWYTNSTEYQKMILFMMMKSQCVPYFTGAGIMEINVYAFGSVIRKSFSFYAVMQNVLRK
ncbi:7tm Odorant receptor [Popillia japonica]|uniref:7tm Odorant receptor n=1 Tax=Popillia japonica TaxID=7064 RepID=A0AAW1JLK3_POPJA